MIAGLAACSDLSPVASPGTAPAVHAARSSLNDADQSPARATYTCNLGWSDEAGVFQARAFRLRFPRAELDPAGRTRAYLYRGYSSGGEVALLGACEIPATDAAVARTDRFFRLGNRPRFGYPLTIQGCVSDGVCVLEEITVTACQNGGTYPACETAQPIDLDVYNCYELGTCPDYIGSGGGGGPGGGSAGPAPCWECGAPVDGVDYEEPLEDEGSNCPSWMLGKVITALIPIAGRNHQFDFAGAMPRISGPRSPAKYSISGETASEDNWWIARTGWISVRCLGVFSPYVNGRRAWIGRATYAGENDLHMVMSASHPDF